jgi:type VI secretion system secreted protein VgrG
MNSSWEFSGSTASGKNLPAFRVLGFSGQDSVCQGYAFNVLVLAADVQAAGAVEAQKDLITATKLTLTGRRDGGESFVWHGVAGEVSWLFNAAGASLFRVLLRPHSCKLRLSSHSRIFLNLALPQLLDKLLQD